MAFTASPEQLHMLRQAVDDYCQKHGVIDENDRMHVAGVASSLFDLGRLNEPDPLRALEEAMGPALRAVERLARDELP